MGLRAWVCRLSVGPVSMRRFWVRPFVAHRLGPFVRVPPDLPVPCSSVESPHLGVPLPHSMMIGSTKPLVRSAGGGPSSSGVLRLHHRSLPPVADAPGLLASHPEMPAVVETPGRDDSAGRNQKAFVDCTPPYVLNSGG